MKKLNANPLAENLVEIIWKFGPQGLDKQCCADLSMVEYRAMTIISEIRSCSVQDIGKHLGFTKSGATRIANRLEKKGFITKEKWAHDNRICCLMPTPEGVKSLATASQSFTESLDKVLEVMTPEQRNNLGESLGALARAIKISE